jgi:hypothetical protein
MASWKMRNGVINSTGGGIPNAGTMQNRTGGNVAAYGSDFGLSEMDGA